MQKANFFINGGLANLLLEYSTLSVFTLKELVDYSWNEDANNVWITLPENGFDENSFITYRDDGIGLSSEDLKNGYFNLEKSKAKGRISTFKKRKLKKIKGLGKFVGLTLANKMIFETCSNCELSSFSISKNDLKNANSNLENLEVILNTCSNINLDNGTKIELTEFNPSFITPDLEKLQKSLILEYGRENNFNIFINDKKLSIENIGGDHFEFERIVDENKRILLSFNITDTKLTKANFGIALKIENEIVGEPKLWGLDEMNTTSTKLLSKIYGEVHADFLKSDALNTETILENTLDYKLIKDFICEKISTELNNKFKGEIKDQTNFFELKIVKRLSNLPENKRKFADEKISVILKSLYGENENKIDSVLNVILESLEKDIYFNVIDSINDASEQDVTSFSNALSEFSLADGAIISEQIKTRLKFLEYIQKLIVNEETTKVHLHRAIDQNMWIFGQEYSLMTSNISTNSVVAKYLKKDYSTGQVDTIPQLLLNKGYKNSYLLLVFNDPSTKIGKDHETQAIEYKDGLKEYISNAYIETIVLGGSVDANIYKDSQNIRLMSYDDLIFESRSQLEWSFSEIKKD